MWSQCQNRKVDHYYNFIMVIFKMHSNNLNKLLLTSLYLANSFTRTAGQEEYVRITQHPEPFFIDGKSNITLTCVRLYDPSPWDSFFMDVGGNQTRCFLRYNERRDRIIDSHICTFTPDIGDSDKNVNCYIFRDLKKPARSGTILPKYVFPPQSEPNIKVWAHKSLCTDVKDPGLKVGPGTTLKCEIKEGRPPGTKVSLTCDSPHQPDPDLPDEAGSNSTATYTTITDPKDGDGKISCTCSASWTPPNYNVTKSSSKIFDIFRNSQSFLSISIDKIGDLKGGENETTQVDQSMELTPNSVLKCELRGDKRKFSNITFSCESPHIPDMPDEEGSGFSASYVTVGNMPDDDGSMTCTCSVSWVPEPYKCVKTASFRLPRPSNKDPEDAKGGTDGTDEADVQAKSMSDAKNRRIIMAAVITCLVGFALSVVFFVINRPRRRNDATRHPSRSRHEAPMEMTESTAATSDIGNSQSDTGNS